MADCHASQCTAGDDPRLREAIGAYLLGALEPGEADEVAAHLCSCERCRAVYGELSELMPLMALIGEQEAVRGPVRPRPAVLDRVLTASRQPSAGARASGRRGPSRADPAAIETTVAPRRLRRVRLALAAVMACMVLAVGGAAVGMRISSHAASQTAWSASVMVDHYGDASGDVDITAVADVTPAARGSRISLTMRGVPANYRCSMIVIGTDGRRESDGTWTAARGGSFIIPADSSLSPDHIASIEVDLTDGSVLLRVTHP